MPAPAVRRSEPKLAKIANIAKIYDLYRARVFRRARTLLRDPERARDATQEVFLRAVKDPRSVGAHPLPWLFRVTKNLCLNNLRDHRRRAQLLAGRAAQIGDDGAAHARLMVSELLARVPAELREIAAHYYLDDLSHEDIAALVGVSRRTVGNRLAAFQAIADELMLEEAGTT